MKKIDFFTLLRKNGFFSDDLCHDNTKLLILTCLRSIWRQKENKQWPPIVSIITFGAMAYVDTMWRKRSGSTPDFIDTNNTAPRRKDSVIYRLSPTTHTSFHPPTWWPCSRTPSDSPTTPAPDGNVSHGRSRPPAFLVFTASAMRRKKLETGKKAKAPPPPPRSHRRKKQHTCVKCFVTHKNFCNNSTYSNNVTRENAH